MIETYWTLYWYNEHLTCNIWCTFNSLTFQLDKKLTNKTVNYDNLKIKSSLLISYYIFQNKIIWNINHISKLCVSLYWCCSSVHFLNFIYKLQWNYSRFQIVPNNAYNIIVKYVKLAFSLKTLFWAYFHECNGMYVLKCYFHIK